MTIDGKWQHGVDLGGTSLVLGKTKKGVLSLAYDPAAAAVQLKCGDKVLWKVLCDEPGAQLGSSQRTCAVASPGNCDVA